MIRKIVYFILALLMLVDVHTATDAASCSVTHVNAAIAATSAGGTVNVPAGTCDWSAGISTISGITVLGAGSSTWPQTSSSGTVITAGHATLTKHATQYTRFSGFSFTGTDNHITLGGNSSDKMARVDHVYLYSENGEGANRVFIPTVNGVLFDHFKIDNQNCGNCNADIFNIQTSETWTDGDDTIGTADTTGERNFYIEDGEFNQVVETGPDGDARARLVIRHNTFKDSSIVFHSGYQTTTGYSDTTTGGGTRHLEVTNNTFDRVSNAIPMNKWIWVRGTTGVIANNSMERADSPDGFSYSNKPEIRLSLNCNGGAYPMEHQVGQINKVTDTTPDKPLLIYSNTGAGTSDSDFITIDASRSGTPELPCTDPGTYIQLNRDYKLSNTWSYVGFTYPHPLQGSTETASTGKIPLFMRLFLFLLAMLMLQAAVEYGRGAKVDSNGSVEHMVAGSDGVRMDLLQQVRVLARPMDRTEDHADPTLPDDSDRA